MRLWMLSAAIGNYAAAILAGFSSFDPSPVHSASASQILFHYRTFFSVLAVLPAPTIRRWMHNSVLRACIKRVTNL
jgi:hypothetical protein